MRTVVHSLALLIIVWLFALGGNRIHMLDDRIAPNDDEMVAVGKADMHADKNFILESVSVSNVAKELADLIYSLFRRIFCACIGLEDEEHSVVEFGLLLQPNHFILDSILFHFAQPVERNLLSPYFMGSGKPG